MIVYDDYVPTNLAWLPNVPAHWRVLPNYALFEERDERGGTPEDLLLSVTIDRGVMPQIDLGERDSAT